METATKTPVEIIQQLIALFSTRKEAAERLMAKVDNQQVLQSALQSTNKTIEALMSELSQFGDAVMGSVDREDAYQQQWTDLLGQLDGGNRTALQQGFEKMEGTLKTLLQETVAQNNDLPQPVKEIVTKAASEIKAANEAA